ncbi:MAG: hypothetical protein JW697_08875 [Kosmotogaceae bacterium]|nr:hypothetical protein [Kosmotogaceae bacterium]
MVRETLRFPGNKSLLFLKKAGTIIFIVVLVIWVLATFPAGVEYGSRESYSGVIGSAVAPLMKPMGIDHWESWIAVLMEVAHRKLWSGLIRRQ